MPHRDPIIDAFVQTRLDGTKELCADVWSADLFELFMNPNLQLSEIFREFRKLTHVTFHQSANSLNNIKVERSGRPLHHQYSAEPDKALHNSCSVYECVFLLKPFPSFLRKGVVLFPAIHNSVKQLFFLLESRNAFSGSCDHAGNLTSGCPGFLSAAQINGVFLSGTAKI